MTAKPIVRIALAIMLMLAGLAGLATAAWAQDTRDCADCPEMMHIKAGAFIMGAAPDEEEREKIRPQFRGRAQPQHEVSVGAFSLGKYPVTRAQYAAFVAATSHSGMGCRGYLGAKGPLMNPELSWSDPSFPQEEDEPVVCVSWEDAQAYVQWLSGRTHKRYRLPSEAEWEYAARAGTTTARYWGDDREQACQYANAADRTGEKRFNGWTLYPGFVFPCSDGYYQTSPVGKFKPNAWGLYDMLGNVQQWTADCWNGNYKGAPQTGEAQSTGDCSNHVIRGASWFDAAWDVRAAVRQSGANRARTSPLGFRVARSENEVVSQRAAPKRVAALGP